MDTSIHASHFQTRQLPASSKYNRPEKPNVTTASVHDRIASFPHDAKLGATEATSPRRAFVRLLLGRTTKGQTDVKIPHTSASKPLNHDLPLARTISYSPDDKPRNHRDDQLHVSVCSTEGPAKVQGGRRRPKTSEGVVRARWHLRFGSSKEETPPKHLRATTQQSAAMDINPDYTGSAIPTTSNSSSSSYSDPTLSSDFGSSVSPSLNSPTSNVSAGAANPDRQQESETQDSVPTDAATSQPETSTNPESQRDSRVASTIGERETPLRPPRSPRRSNAARFSPNEAEHQHLTQALHPRGSAEGLLQQEKNKVPMTITETVGSGGSPRPTSNEAQWSPTFDDNPPTGPSQANVGSSARESFQTSSEGAPQNFSATAASSISPRSSKNRIAIVRDGSTKSLSRGTGNEHMKSHIKPPGQTGKASMSIPQTVSTPTSQPKSASDGQAELVAPEGDAHESGPVMTKQSSFPASGRRHTIATQQPRLPRKPSKPSGEAAQRKSTRAPSISFAPNVRQVNRPAPKGLARFMSPTEDEVGATLAPKEESPEPRPVTKTSGRGGAGRRPSTAPESGGSLFLDPELVFYPRTLILVRKNVDLSDSDKPTSASGATADQAEEPAEDEKKEQIKPSRRSWWRRQSSSARTDEETHRPARREPIQKDEPPPVQALPPVEDGHVVLWHGQAPRKRSLRRLLRPTTPKTMPAPAPAISRIVSRDRATESRAPPILSQSTLPSYYPVKTRLDMDWYQQPRMH